MDGEIRVREMWPRGTVIKGDYVIERKLGSGGFGAVYIANHRFLGSKHVIKRLHEQYASDQEYVRKFVNEGRAVRRLKTCPNVVEVEHMTQTEDGHLILVMEYVGGGDLDALIQSRPIAIDEAITFGRQIAQGLQAAHEAKLIHRDIKPQNILIGQDTAGRTLLKLIDFGLVKDHNSTGQTSVMRSGTLGYAAPEQWMRSGKEIDGRADLYSLGATLYRMICGRMPYQFADDIMPWMAQAMLTPPPAPETLRPGCPTELSALILQLLSPKPEGRPADAGEVIRRLDAITPSTQPAAAPAPITAPALLPATPARPFPKVAVAAAGCIAVLGLSAWALIGYLSPSEETRKPKGTGGGKDVAAQNYALNRPQPLPKDQPPHPVEVTPPPKKPDYAALGDAARDKGDLATALRHYRQASDSKRLTALQNTVEGDTEERATAFMDRGQFPDALKLTDRWLSEFPQSQRLQRLRARIIRARDSQ